MKKNEKENHIKNKPDKTNKGFLSGLLLGAGKIIYDNITKKEKNNNDMEEESVLKKSIENNNKQFKSKDNNNKKKINKILEKLLENNLDKNNNLILPNYTNVNHIDKNSLLCPLSNKIIIDPVITPENITYEKNSLLNYLEKNECKSKTKRKINKNEVIPNFIIIPFLYNYHKKS